VRYTSEESLQGAYKKLKGQLTTTFLGAEDSLSPQWRNQLENHCGRLVFNGVPTGVKIVKSMHHGGPFPSTTDPRFSAVGMDSMKRFQRNIAVQNTL
jgi:NADP-dependent aldehyde dehydrogenase